MSNLQEALKAAKHGDEPTCVAGPLVSEWDFLMANTKVAVMRALGYELTALEVSRG